MQKSRPHFARGVLFALVGGISWAFSGTCAEFLFETQHLSPAWVTSVRCMISGVAFLLLAAIIDRERFLEAAKSKRAWGAFAVNGLFGTVFCQFTYLTAISYTNSGTTTVLSMVGLALVMGYSCRASHRLPRKRELFGLALTLVGVVLIATHGDINRLAMPLPGLVWGLLSACGLAAYNIIPIKLIGRFGSLVTMGFSMFIAGVCMCFIEQPWTVPVELNAEVLGGMAAIIVVGTIIAAWIYMQAIADIGAVKASMIAAVEPVAATVFTVVFLGTHFEPVDIVGFVCIIAMVLLVSSKPDEEQKTAESLAGKTGVEDSVHAPDGVDGRLGKCARAAAPSKPAEPETAAPEAVAEPEPVVLWDPVVSKKAREKANSGELTLEEMICSPEAAHLVEVKSNTKDTVRHGTRERIALIAFACMVAAGFIALTTYISAGHNLNYASTGIDDIAGDMSGYGVILFEGTVDSKASTTDSGSSASISEAAKGAKSDEADISVKESSEEPVNDAFDDASTVAKEAGDSGLSASSDVKAPSSEGSKEQAGTPSVKSIVKKALGLDASSQQASGSAATAAQAASDASGVVREPMTLSQAKSIYEDKKASVIELDVNDIDQYQFGRIMMKGGHSYGIVSITSEEIDALGLPSAKVVTETTVTTSRESSSSTTATTKTKTKGAYSNVSELLADVDPEDIDAALVKRLEDVIGHFHDAGVDIVVVLTPDVRPLAAIEGVDVAITVRTDSRFSQSQMVGHTLYVDAPETDSVGALLVAPGNVVSSRVLTGEVSSSPASAETATGEQGLGESESDAREDAKQ